MAQYDATMSDAFAMPFLCSCVSLLMSSEALQPRVTCQSVRTKQGGSVGWMFDLVDAAKAPFDADSLTSKAMGPDLMVSSQISCYMYYGHSMRPPACHVLAKHTGSS